MDTRSCFGEDYSSKFDPVRYLSDVYSSNSFLLNEKVILHKLYESLGKMENVKEGRLLEFGCGPTVHTAFLASRVFNEITMAEYAKPNRDMVEKWLRKEDGAFDWSPFLNFVAEMEQNDPDTITKRTRAAVKDVIPCDVTNDNILLDSNKGLFDFIISSLCLEAACVDLISYKKAMCDLCSLIKAGGKLFLFGIYEQTFYMVNDCRFFSLSVTKEEVTQAVENAAMTIESFDHAKVEGFEEVADCVGYYCLVASKKA